MQEFCQVVYNKENVWRLNRDLNAIGIFKWQNETIVTLFWLIWFWFVVF